MWLGVKKSSFWFYSILLLIAAYPFNIRLLGFLSPPDVVFVIVFGVAVLWGGLKKSKIDPLVFLFLLFFLATSFIGAVFFDLSVHYLVFLYKYLLVFLLAWFILSADLKRGQILFLLSALLFSFCFLVLYVYFYQYLVISGAKVFPRPDFPFSPAEAVSSGAHLYGAYLSTGLMACSAYWLFISRRSIFWILLSLLSIGAVLLTGSRAPLIALLAGYAVLAVIYLFEKKTRTSVKNLLGFALLALVAMFLFFGIFAEEVVIFEKAIGVMERAVSFSAITKGGDGSVLGRMQKIEMGLDAVLSNSVIFGTGVSSTPFIWVDNSIVRLLIDTGFGGLMLFAVVLLTFMANALKTARANGNIRLFYVFFLACLVYFVNSVSTEFFLVTRSIVPFLVLVCLIYKLLSMPDNELKTGEQ